MQEPGASINQNRYPGFGLVTKRDLAAQLKLSVRSVDNLVRRKAIPIIRISPAVCDSIRSRCAVRSANMKSTRPATADFFGTSEVRSHHVQSVSRESRQFFAAGAIFEK